MKLVYIDESGDTTALSQAGTSWFVLSAYIIDEVDRVKVETDLRDIKYEFYKDRDIEFKSNFIRYANPDIPKQESPLKLHSRERYNDLEGELTKFLARLPGSVLSVAIEKKSYWDKYPSQNPYTAAYMFLLERIQMYLHDNSSLGIVIIDPREGRVEKSFIGDHLERLHHMMRFRTSHVWQTSTPNVVERLLYSDSSSTIGIQIADLYCYPVFHIFEYNKEPSAYWRYEKTTGKKLHRKDGKLLGRGLKIFPNVSKNGLE